jgi:cytochrome c553
MKEIIFPILLGITGLLAIILFAYNSLSNKGYEDVHSCFGECYEAYTLEHGTFLEQLELKKLARLEADPAEMGSKVYVNCAMCHGQAGEGGIGPKLVGSTSIVDMLMQYKNGETRGEQSALMWGQAANLSTQDMENLQAYINTFK